MDLSDFTSLLEKILPSSTGMEGDRIGLQLQSGRSEIHSMLTALDLNDEVIDEAVRLACDCIVIFHPLIFRSIIEIKDDERVGRLITKAIQNRLAAISIHTAFDAYSGGSNKLLADAFGFKPMEFLDTDTVYPDRGMGLITQSSSPIFLDELVQMSSSIFKSPVRYCNGRNAEISKVAFVAGSGSSYLSLAYQMGCQAMITADVTYHTFHAYDGRMAIIDPGHYEMEQFIPKHLSQMIQRECVKRGFAETKFHVSEVLTNPVKYYPNTEKYYQEQKNYLTK